MIKTDDSMPQQICRLCLEKLNFTCAFYDNCHEIQKKLWSTIEAANNDNNVEDKENMISPRSNIKCQIRTILENLKKETHLTNADSLIIDALPKSQSHENHFKRNCLREICSNTQTATNSWTQEQPVGIQKNKRDGLAQKETIVFEKAMRQEIDIIKECSLSENLSSRTLSPSLLNNSMEFIHSLDWSLRLSCEADKRKNVTNATVNNSPPPGDEAELNRSSSFESSNLTVSNNIGRSPPNVPNVPKEVCPLESNTVSFQNNKSTVLSESSIIDGCKEKHKHSKISELITNEQKQIIETYYLVNTDIMNKYEEKVRSNITVRDKNNIECNLCAAKYSRLDKCQVHIWAHLNIKPYKCKKCNFSTVTPSNIRCHIRKSHLKIKPFACKLCPKQYATFALLKEHDNIHIGIRPYKCETCGFSSTSRQVLMNHMSTHMSSEDIPCNICNKIFHSRIRMRAHMRIHNGNNVTCDICRIRLSNEKALEAHRKTMHVHDYICKICNKVSKSRKALLNHMNIHKEAKYKCTKCSKAYKSKHMLNDHLLKHEGIRKYKCFVCAKSFAQQSHLAAHNKVHNPPSYECPGCGRKHNRRDNMKTHMMRCKSCQ